MRNLTIKREKSLVACFAKSRIYIEDHVASEIVINGTPCRKLGELKNGEEKSFQISNDELKVFVISDKLSKSYSNDFFIVPNGDSDVFLSGKHKYNPATGNAFRFNNNDNEESNINRKKGARKGLIILCIAFAVGIVIGILSVILPFKMDKTFTNDDMSITITGEFEETSLDGYDVCYDSSEIAIFVIKESFKLMPVFGSYTLEEYGELVMINNDLHASLQTQNGLTYFEYEYENYEENIVFKYRTYIFKTDSAFWIIQFAGEANDFENRINDIEKWAESIEFASTNIK
ncbi:MAG: hypothetical protein J6K52_03060 [Clostridia bacterium]|nr:hypothetical protein [Clostridia bacterium]